MVALTRLSSAPDEHVASAAAATTSWSTSLCQTCREQLAEIVDATRAGRSSRLHQGQVQWVLVNCLPNLAVVVASQERCNQDHGDAFLVGTL